ncbi:hypothetical protein ACSXAY_18775 (plasmid) [Clostridium perfringens]
MNVKCDKCHVEFEMCIQEEKIKDDLEMNFFLCPNCGEKYKCFITNSKIRNKQKVVRELNNELNRTKSFGKRIKLEKRINKLKQEISKDYVLLSKQHKNIW